MEDTRQSQHTDRRTTCRKSCSRWRRSRGAGPERRYRTVGQGEALSRPCSTRTSPSSLLEVAMPDMDGFETARLIRQRKPHRGTPDHISVTGSPTRCSPPSGDEMRRGGLLCRGGPRRVRTQVGGCGLLTKDRAVEAPGRGARRPGREQASRAAAEAATRRSPSAPDRTPSITRANTGNVRMPAAHGGCRSSRPGTPSASCRPERPRPQRSLAGRPDGAQRVPVAHRPGIMHGRHGPEHVSLGSAGFGDRKGPGVDRSAAGADPPGEPGCGWAKWPHCDGGPRTYHGVVGPRAWRRCFASSAPKTRGEEHAGRAAVTIDTPRLTTNPGGRPPQERVLAMLGHGCRQPAGADPQKRGEGGGGSRVIRPTGASTPAPALGPRNDRKEVR